MYGYTIFHEKLMQTLIDSARENRCSNAYIFEGEKGMYKHECARLFAAALACTSGNAPCCECNACVTAEANTNPDIKHITKPKDKKKIDVETIRAVSEEVIIRPYASKRKIYIIDEGDIMTPEAQNAFLKTFEEPPEYAVFIIVAQSSENLLQTIRSRAEIISFTPVERNVIAQYIKNKYPEEEERAPFLLNYCEGVPGRIDEIVADDEFEEHREGALKMLSVLLSPKKERAFEIEDYISKNSDNAQMIFDFWISFLRDMLVLQCGAYDRAVNVDKLSPLKKLTEYILPKKTTAAIDIIIEGKHMLARYVKTSAAALWCALKINEIK